jgi:hypothetical protein
MAREIVPVLHGVANPDEKDFNGRVSHLSELLGGKWQLVPVFWNPVGSQPLHVDDALPRPGPRGTRGRAGLARVDDIDGGISLLGGSRTKGRSTSSVRGKSDGDRQRKVLEGATGDAAGSRSATSAVRGVDEAREIQDAIEEVWPTLQTVPQIDDAETLRLVGALVNAAVAERTAGPSGTRGWFDEIRGIAKQVLTGADNLLGAILGRAGEQLHDLIRRSIVPGAAKGIGDVFVYQAHRQAVHDQVLEIIRRNDPTLATAARPISILGHSLGGIIAFDLATRSKDPLHYKALVTFGSQSSILHVLDPRGGRLNAYTPPPSVLIPDNIGHWTNIWEAWDPLAFAMRPVYGPQDRVKDVRIPHRSTAPVFSHSEYWTQDDAVGAMREALERASTD